ncbi:hypothetical protein VTK73DRAFT_356 [Phialemonium thermophilum]|uniref:peptidyl-tRNA hydrolase n=1 Tax=Phialemonium thermophilum TaxID=223376 RepID=A0ABR3VVL6_9PEZI
MFNPRFLVVSLGNPAPYTDTLHSAGHIVLSALQSKLLPENPSFSPRRLGKKTALVSAGPKYLLAQSPTLMNVSGPWVSRAWQEELESCGGGRAAERNLALVLVHDDLEEELGVVKARPWGRSHRGHNGIKSVNASLRPSGEEGSPLWARVSVGIGRPEGRDAATVSEYVLRKMRPSERAVLEGEAPAAVLEVLLGLERQWEREQSKRSGQDATA